MGSFFVFYFCRVFDCFRKERRVFLIKYRHSFRDAPYKTAVHFGPVKKHCIFFLEFCYVIIDCIIRLQGHPVRSKRCSHALRKCLFICKQQDLPVCHYEIRKHDRIARNVSASDIQQPCNVVKRSKDECIRALLLHPASYPAALILP